MHLMGLPHDYEIDAVQNVDHIAQVRYNDMLNEGCVYYCTTLRSKISRLLFFYLQWSNVPTSSSLKYIFIIPQRINSMLEERTGKNHQTQILTNGHPALNKIRIRIKMENHFRLYIFQSLKQWCNPHRGFGRYMTKVEKWHQITNYHLYNRQTI